MTEDLTGMTAFGWSLHKPPYLSAGKRVMRGRHVWIMTVDNYLIHGFGVTGREPRFTVIRYANAAAAQRHAVTQTQRREKEGFVLNMEPRTAVTRGGKRSWMEDRVGTGKANEDLFATVTHLIDKGTILDESLSPAVSPVLGA